MKTTVLSIILFFICYATMQAQDFRHAMRIFPDSSKFNLVKDKFPAKEALSRKGWYYSVAGIVSTPSGYVASYRRSDFHTATFTDIMVAYSKDGRAWSGHHSIAHADVWHENSVWIAPQITKLRSGKLVIICDLGNRTSGQDWPMLSDWQKPNRGMSNHLFWSDDDGKTWSAPQQCDNVGGEPGYITEMQDGKLIYTRTVSKKTDKLWNPPMPWGDIYYLSQTTRSLDGGKTWENPVTLADSPFIGDCEVGTAELGPDTLLAITRVGFGGGYIMQPSRFVYSYNGGTAWDKPFLSPIYAQRPIVRKLKSGKLLTVYRNCYGTSGTYAFLFDQKEKFDYTPTTFIYNEDRCLLKDGVMTLKTGSKVTDYAFFGFYPAQSPDAIVTIEASLKVDQADIDGCNIGAGCWVRFMPNRVCLAEKPEIGFDVDATQWHDYKIVRGNGKITILVDGKEKLKAPINGLENRLVTIGSRQVKNFAWDHIGDEKNESSIEQASISHWKALHVSVDNKEDYDIDWSWNPSKGYPDQFRRDRLIGLDIIASAPGHCGYPSISQDADGKIIIADYTVGGNGGTPTDMPFIRAYITTEKELMK